MCGDLITDFLKVYQSISGITGHPLKNQFINLKTKKKSWVNQGSADFLKSFALL
jgi:hypothetical protein